MDMAKEDKQKEYNHLIIEKKWQKEWNKKKVYKTRDIQHKSMSGPHCFASSKKCYVLDMFPYPSGVGLHVGHPKGYIASDVYSRMKRMQGYNVLHPMGYDAFGLPAEQYALEHKIAPQKAVTENIKTFRKQLDIIGLSYDWDRVIDTTDPAYYRWTQWIFLKLYNSWYNKDKEKAEPIGSLIKIFEKYGNEKVKAVSQKIFVFSAMDWKLKTAKERQDILMNYRLAYEGYSEVNWCPVLGTVLANDEVLDSPKGPVSERGGYPVVKKEMRQWFLRITAYAGRLLSGLEGLDWSSHLKEIQRNWIGESKGLLFKTKVKDTDLTIETFSAHLQACYADTFFVIAPDHPLLPKLVEGLPEKDIILKKAKDIVEKRNMFPEGEYREIDGIFSGRYGIDPLGNGDLPIWVASFALKDYGTGIVKCSAHDERDFVFAKKFDIPLKVVLMPTDEELGKKVLAKEVCFSDMENGIITEPRELMGRISGDVKHDIIKYVTSRGFAKKHTTYKMRDAVFARQRYWGEPIPLKHDKDGIIFEIPENKLPLKLPKVKSFMPTGTGESPLAGVPSWVKEGLETNTMPGWAGSSWYYLAYMTQGISNFQFPISKNDAKAKKTRKNISYWKSVDMYVGGAEHATGHLLYARFWNKLLKDYGLVVEDEPFKCWRNQGMILAPDNRKMSKRWGNVINPDDVVRNYGADTLRLYEMFMGPFEASLPWSTDNIIGARRFIEKVWRIADKVRNERGQTLKRTTDNKFENVQRSSALSPVVSSALLPGSSPRQSANFSIEKLLHKTIKKVTDDITNFAFNTAVSSMMILLNEMERIVASGQEIIARKDFELFLKILSPFAPHITEEIWKELGNKSMLVLEKWPKADMNKTRELDVKIVVQINGRVRAMCQIHIGAEENEVVELVREMPEVEKWLINKVVLKVIFIPNKIVNFVTS